MMYLFLLLSLSAFSSTSMVVAHRGAHNPFRAEDFDCPTKRLISTKLPWVENTIRSVNEAFAHNADMVEVDLRVTKDNQVVMFHDEEVSCKTNGHGKVRDLTLKELTKLDLGFNFSGDDGKTFPFRGTAIGQIVTVEELLKAFPGKKFLFNFKDFGHGEAEVFARRLLKISDRYDFLDFHYWGAHDGYLVLKKILPEFGAFYPVPYQMKTCYQELEYLSWFGYIPPTCRKKQVSFNPKERALPFFVNLLSQVKKYSQVVLWNVNSRRDFIGHYGLVPIIFTGEILKLGPPFTPYHPDYLLN
jgi:glycerophosphoryl diester phosphodiesterase